MKLTMNFSISEDDVGRCRDSADLRGFYRQFGLSGLEVMPLSEDDRGLITPDMTVGVHACCLTDWMHLDPQWLLAHYRRDLEYAKSMQAEYVVFHVTQAGYAESLTYRKEHSNEEVVDAAAAFINQLLDGVDANFYFLMENLWYPGLTFEDPAITRRLLDQIHYPKKGLMLDTGHFMNTNPDLQTPEDALLFLNQMLDAHEDLIPMMKGIHLNQSLSGSYVREFQKHLPTPAGDPNELAAQAFLHIFQVDQHRPFVADGVRELVQRIDPLFVTLEYITRDRAEHAAFLRRGVAALN